MTRLKEACLNFGNFQGGGGGGGDSLTKVGTDVRRVQNLGRAKFPKKT